MGKDVYKAGLHLRLSNIMAAAKLTVLTFVLLVGLVSNVSPQRTYQRACDCEYMVNGKCAYTLLLPTGGSGDGTCPSAGAGGSETMDYFIRNITNRVNNLYDIAMNQSLLLTRVQDAIIGLQQNKPYPQQPPSSFNDSGWSERQEAIMASLNATLQSQAKELDQLKMTTEMLSRNLSTLTGLSQLQTTELLRLQLVVNETKAALDKQTSDDEKISQLSDAVKLLRQASCIRRAPLFSGPDRLNGTNIRVSSSYNNETNNYGPQQLAIDHKGIPGGWCPRQSFLYTH